MWGQVQINDSCQNWLRHREDLRILFNRTSSWETFTDVSESVNKRDQRSYKHNEFLRTARTVETTEGQITNSTPRSTGMRPSWSHGHHSLIPSIQTVQIYRNVSQSPNPAPYLLSWVLSPATARYSLPRMWSVLSKTAWQLQVVGLLTCQYLFRTADPTKVSVIKRRRINVIPRKATFGN